MSGRRLIGRPLSEVNHWTSSDFLLFIMSRSAVAAGLLYMQDPLIAPPRISMQQTAPPQQQQYTTGSVGGMQLPFSPPTAAVPSPAQQQQQADAAHPPQVEQAAQTGFISRMFGAANKDAQTTQNQ